VQTRLVVETTESLRLFGLPGSWLTSTRVEVLLNAVIVAPLSLLGSIALPRLRWQDWTSYALIGAIAVELFQGVFLPDRSASFSDIVANAVGALLGALGYRCAVWFSGRTAG
jgi:VanZ family protein